MSKTADDSYEKKSKQTKKSKNMIQINNRSSIRGLKKCSSCGRYNGIRAFYCKNKSCSLTLSPTVIKRMREKSLLKSIRLVSHTDYKLYSVRVSDRGRDLRNFVRITDKTISTDDEGSIISRNAICFVETCKYDSNNMSISCRHIKNSTNSSSTAEVLIIQQSTLFDMRSDEKSNQLWQFYCDNENVTPIVQRIGASLFVVKSEISKEVPAGLVHVTLLIGGSSKCEKM